MTSEELPKYVVRLRCGIRTGTGFLVGSGLIVTCAHVIDDAEEAVIEAAGRQLIGRLVSSDSSETLNGTPFPDVAILKIVSGEMEGGLELDHNVEPGDNLFAWGFPPGTEGDSIQGECEGVRRFGQKPGQWLIKLRATQLTAGFSGAPLLNLRTRKVCGMLKRTRDASAPAGGYAVCASTILNYPCVEAAQLRLETPLRTAVANYLSELIERCKRHPKYFLIDGDQPDVPRRLQRIPIAELRKKIGDKATAEQAKQEADVVEWARIRRDGRFSRVWVLGSPGLGKTWFLRSEATTSARECLERLRASHAIDLDIPLLLNASSLARFSESPFDKAIELTLDASGVDDLVKQLILRLLVRGRGVILIDAWDEVPKNSGIELRRSIATWARNYSGRLILASRPLSSEQFPVDAERFELVPLSVEEASAIAASCLGSANDGFLNVLDSRPDFLSVARTPLFVMLLCRIWRTTPSVRLYQFSDRLGELLLLALKSFIKDWRQEDKGADVLDAEVEKSLSEASMLAFGVYPAAQFSSTDVARHVPGDTGSVVRRMLNEGILSRVGHPETEVFCFVHRTFHEYLAARCLAGMVWDEELIDRLSWQAEWTPVLVFLAGELSEPKHLLKCLATSSKDDLFRPRLALALLCAAGVPTSKRDPSINDALCTEAIEIWLGHSRRGTTEVLGKLTSAMKVLPAINAHYRGQQLETTVVTKFRDWSFWGLVNCVGFDGNLDVAKRILSRFTHEDETEVRRAANVLQRMPRSLSHPEVLDQLQGYLGDKRDVIWQSAVDVLSTIDDPTVREWITSCLLGKLGSLDWGYLSRLSQYGAYLTSDAVANHLLTPLDEQDPDRQCQDLWLMFRVEENRPGLVDKLLEWLPHHHYVVRRAAARGLGQLGQSAAGPLVLEKLAQWIIDPRVDFRRGASAAVAHLGSLAVSPVILGLFSDASVDSDTEVRENIAVAMGKIWPAFDGAERLVAMLEDPDRGLRRAAVEALGAIVHAGGPREIAEHLAHCINDPSHIVRESAAKTLGSLGVLARSPSVLAIMVNSLRVDPPYPAPEVELRLYDRDTRTDVITALGLIGLDHDRGDAVSLLLEWVKYPPADTQASKSEIEQQFDRAHKASFRGVAIEALGRIGALEDPVIVEHVAKCLDDPEWSVGRAACEALAQIGAPDFDAWILSRLIAEFRMGDDAATAVRRMTAPSEVNRLISLLLIWSQEVDPEIKKRAVRSLAKIGRPAAIGKVFRRLISLLDHYDEYVREEAAEVLGGLQGIADVRIASTLSKVEVLRLRFRYWRRRATPE